MASTSRKDGESLERYVERHDIRKLLETIAAQVLKERPPNPAKFISQFCDELDVSEPSEESTECDVALVVAVAAQRSATMHTVKAKLYAQEKEEARTALEQLQKHPDSTQSWFQDKVIAPVREEAVEMETKERACREAAARILEQYIGERDEAQSAVLPLMASDRDEYAKAYGKMNIAICHKIGDMLAEYAPKKGPVQPPLSKGQPTTSVAYLMELVRHAKIAAETSLKDLMDTVVSSCGGVAYSPGTKSLERTIQKTKEKYNGNFSRLLDVGRGMVVFQDTSQLYRALKFITRLEKSGLLQVVRAKDRFSPKWDAILYSGGYRDVLLNLRWSDSGVIVELQLHLQPLLDIKNATGHENYEMARSLHVFNPVFTSQRIYWNEDLAEATLRKLKLGVLTELVLDYSPALSRPESRSFLVSTLREKVGSLRSLSLLGCSMTDSELCGLFSGNQSCILRDLHLGDRARSNKAITDKGIVAISEQCPHLRKLDLYFTGAGPNGIRAILSRCPSIDCIEVGRCFNLGAEGVGLICDAVALGGRLAANAVELDFTGTKCGDEGCRHIATMLARMAPKLQKLNLRRCSVTSTGICVLSPALPGSIEYLNLGRNQITDVGGYALLERISSEINGGLPCLENLNLGYAGDISKTIVDAIAAALPALVGDDGVLIGVDGNKVRAAQDE